MTNSATWLRFSPPNNRRRSMLGKMLKKLHRCPANAIGEFDINELDLQTSSGAITPGREHDQDVVYADDAVTVHIGWASIARAE